MTTSTLKSTIQSAKSGLGAFDLLASLLFKSPEIPEKKTRLSKTKNNKWIAYIDQKDFDNFRSSGFNDEFNKLPYEGYVTYEKGVYAIIGKEQIELFVKNINLELDVVATTFKDKQSIAEIAHDRALLDTLLGKSLTPVEQPLPSDQPATDIQQSPLEKWQSLPLSARYVMMIDAGILPTGYDEDRPPVSTNRKESAALFSMLESDWKPDWQRIVDYFKSDNTMARHSWLLEEAMLYNGDIDKDVYDFEYKLGMALTKDREEAGKTKKGDGIAIRKYRQQVFDLEDSAKKGFSTGDFSEMEKYDKDIFKNTFSFIAEYKNLQLAADENTIEPEGDDSNVKTSKGSKVSTKFTVVEASKLIVSHDEQGKPNPEYPKEFQPRDRARETSQAWVQRVAKDLEPSQLGESRNAAFGAPIIGKDRVVESGNGRAAAIILAYKLNLADEYKAWILKNAKTFGVSESKIKGMKRPVLVRVRTSDVGRVQFAMEANQSDMLAMTATEKAKSDANRLNDSLMSRLSGDGDLNSLANRDFIMDFLKSLGESEAAQYSTTDGMPTKQLYDRVQAALFAKAYNDDRLLEMMAESEKVEIANTIKALNQAAPHFIRARAISHKVTDGVTRQVGDAVELSLDDQAVNALIEATNVIKAAKNSGMSLEEYLKQTNVFGDDVDPVVAQMAISIKENNRSANRMGVAFQTMAEFVADELERRQNESLFVDDPEIELLDVPKAANERLKKQFGDDVKTIGGGTGGFIDIFTETKGQKKDREAFLANQPPKVTDNANIDMLKAVIKGDYDNESSEDLLTRIETAMNGVSFDYDAIMLDSLVSKAMDKWLEVDNKAYLLDSVDFDDTSGIMGWFDNTVSSDHTHGIIGWFDNTEVA